jgi:uncharacterized protein YqjF (DUF2071 family)
MAVCMVAGHALDGWKLREREAMRKFVIKTLQRPRPLPAGPWLMTQRWNDLLLAHWPVSAAAIGALLPEGLQADTFRGSAWLGVMPFWMDRIKLRGAPTLFGMRGFPELTLRTYVRDQRTGTPGIYLFSKEARCLLAALVGRGFYNLPMHWAEVRLTQRSQREFEVYSRRRLSSQPVIFQARYRGLGPSNRIAEISSGTLENFVTERYCLFSRNRAGQAMRANIHQVPWPLEEAEALIERNDLAAAIGIELPDQEPVLHYARRLAIYIWPAELVRAVMVARPVRVAVTPT